MSILELIALYVGITYKIMDGELGLIANQRSLIEISNQIKYISRLILLVAALGIILFAVLGVILANRTMQPINELSQKVKETIGGKQVAITVNESSELTPIVDAFNLAWKENLDAQKKMLQEKRLAEIAKQKAEEANKAKSSFLANMSHEIRTPMNGIIGLSYLAVKKSRDNEVTSYVTKIQESAKNLLVIINDILDYSKIEADSLELEIRVISIKEIIDNVAELFTYQVEQKGLALNKIISPQVPEYIMGDSLRLNQVLINLLGNAVKFTESGQIEIMVDIQEVSGKKKKILFTIKDSGIGIAEEKQGVLFDVFTQADGSITRKHGGTGLGLTITKQLVELMGGSIWFESQLGVGSVFYFTLDLNEAGAEVEVDKAIGSADVLLNDRETYDLTEERERRDEQSQEKLEELVKELDMLLADDIFIEQELVDRLEAMLPKDQQLAAKYKEFKLTIDQFDYEKARDIFEHIKIEI
ncbi:signal transduction histidine kinase [Desulfitispora alkaliphila]